MKFADGAFKSWGYEIAEKEFDAELFNWPTDETASRQKRYWTGANLSNSIVILRRPIGRRQSMWIKDQVCP